MTAAYSWTERVPRYILCSRPSLWRSAGFQSLRHKQEVRYFYYYKKRLSFLSLECVPHHHQKAYITKTSSLSNMQSNLILSSSKKVQNHGVGGIHEFVHGAAIQSLASDSNIEEAEGPSVENAGMELDISTSRIDPIVYKRRSRRNMPAKKVLTVVEGSHDKLKDLETMAGDASLQGQTEDATTKASRKTGRKRKDTKRVSQCIEACEHTELGTVTRKVATSTLTDTASVFQRRKVIAKTSECTEHLMDCLSPKTEEGNAVSESVEVVITRDFEEHTMDTVIEKVNPWLMLVHKKVQSEWSVYNPLTMRRPEPEGNSMKLLSWNVNGLRSLLKGKGSELPGSVILKLAEKEDFDVLCLQETKLQEKDVLKIKEAILPAYENSLWSCSTAKLGYSGTAVISRIEPLSISYGLGISKHDTEGRVITVEFNNFFLVTCYVPNSGQKLERLAYRTHDWDLSLGNFLKDLEKKKPVILTGDLNCAHQEIDIYNPDGNRRSAGFTDEERTSFEKNFLEKGFNDTFRKLHPNAVAYTYWGYRTAARPKNHGWRLDYYLASDALSDLVHDSYTLPDVEGSDHCPIGLILKL